MMTTICLLLVGILLFAGGPLHVSGKCNMYGENGTKLVFYNGSEKQLPQEGFKIFTTYCSTLLPTGYKTGDPIQTCCDVNQLISLEKNMKMVQALLQGCPVCAQNVFQLSCNLVCSPDQAKFTTVKVGQQHPLLVEEVSYGISWEFAKGLFDSCKDAKLTNSLTPVIKLICTNAVTGCDPKTLIQSMFDQSPLKITAIFSDKNHTILPDMTGFMNKTAMQCNNSFSIYNNTVSACSCLNCDASCSLPPSRPGDSTILVFNYFTIYHFVILVVYVLVLMVGTIFMVVKLVKAKVSKAVVRETLLAYPPLTCDDEESDGNKPDNFTISGRDSCGVRLTKSVHRAMGYGLMKWGETIATYRIMFLILPLLISAASVYGIYFGLELTSDPIDLWSSPNSKMRKEKNMFDSTFGPSYRIEQIVLKPKGNVVTPHMSYDNSNSSFGVIFQKEYFLALFKLEAEIRSLTVNSTAPSSENDSHVVGLPELCIKPSEPYNNNCVVYSVTQYFQGDIGNFNCSDLTHPECNDWLLHLQHCVNNPVSMNDTRFGGKSCMSNFLAPVPANLVLGGYENDPMKADSLVITVVLNNLPTKAMNEMSLKWEQKLIELLNRFSHPMLEISFSTERSIEDELNKETHANIKTVIISYIVMFVYVTFSLGKPRVKRCANFFIYLKITTGFFGVGLVLLSVASSIGFFSFLNYKVTLIVLEVLPFLVLAIGVDNIFILVTEYQRVVATSNGSKTVPTLIGESLSGVGHGMLVSAVAQVATFSIGALSPIPAVSTFSIFAAFAIGFNFFLQMTSFVALLALDSLRESKSRPDVFCCTKFLLIGEVDNRLGFLEIVFKWISRGILHRCVRPIILLLFSGLWFFSLYSATNINVGLDQTAVLPYNSYLQPYFKDVFTKLRAGAPLYVVVTPGFHYEDFSQRKHICAMELCDPEGLSSTILYSSKSSNYSKIALPVDSWVDSYLYWLFTRTDSPCCSYKVLTLNNETKEFFCPTLTTKNFTDCKLCIEDSAHELNPTPEEFNKFLPWFLDDIPNPKCAYGGKPNYKSNVILNPDYYSSKRSPQTLAVVASRFMTYHTPLLKTTDFVDATKFSVEIAKNISHNMNHSVFTYSPFYIYYDSYFDIWKTSFISFGASGATVLLVNLLLYGFNLPMTILMTILTYIMTVCDIGCMHMLQIYLNPVSLVNLLMLTGINVEFLSHIGRGYLYSNKNTKIDRASDALTFAGSSVFRGIALTKILGVSVLGFSRSAFFRVYYFQMYASAILIGTLHGLILLPVLLSYCGPSFSCTPSYQPLADAEQGEDSVETDASSL